MGTRGVTTKIIKRRAHVLTVLALIWTPMSVLAIFMILDRPEDYLFVILFAFGIIGLHIAWIVLAAYLWIYERPRETTWWND